MYKFRVKIISVLFTAAVFGQLNASELPALDEKYEKLFEDLLTEKITSGEMAEELASLEMYITDPVEMAGLFNFTGIILFYTGSQDAAVEKFESALDILENLDDDKAAGSKYYRLFADVISQLASVRGPLFKIKWAGKIMDYAGKAIELDSSDISARLTLLNYYFHAPGIAGGSGKKAIDGIRELADEYQENKINRYLVFLWSAVFHYQNGQTAEARKYLASAYQLYPDNIWTRNFLSSYGINPED